MRTLSFALERDDLCERLGGGIPAGVLVVLEGDHGAGKSIVVQRLAYGLLQHEHSLALVSTELTTSGFLEQLQSLEYEVEEPLLSERLVFIPSYPVIGMRSPQGDLLHRIVAAKRLYTKDVIVFDTFSKILADHVRSRPDRTQAMEEIEAALYLFKRLTGLGKTIVLTFESGQVGEDIAVLFKEAADMFLGLKYEVIGNSSHRRIVVQRLSRASARFGDIIGFRVEPGVGIVVEIRSVV